MYHYNRLKVDDTSPTDAAVIGPLWTTDTADTVVPPGWVTITSGESTPADPPPRRPYRPSVPPPWRLATRPPAAPKVFSRPEFHARSNPRGG